jgi:hypothetical protein
MVYRLCDRANSKIEVEYTSDYTRIMNKVKLSQAEIAEMEKSRRQYVFPLFRRTRRVFTTRWFLR